MSMEMFPGESDILATAYQRHIEYALAGSAAFRQYINSLPDPVPLTRRQRIRRWRRATWSDFRFDLAIKICPHLAQDHEECW